MWKNTGTDFKSCRQHALAERSGSLAIFAAIRRASSLLGNFGGRSPARLILVIDIRELLPGAVDHDKAVVEFFDCPRWRETAEGSHYQNFTYVNGFCCANSGRIQCHKHIVETGKN